jgi:prepilin-type N-terminal cleavage/methylation domain-containing protein
MTFSISNFQFPISRRTGKPATSCRLQIGRWPLAIENGFSLVEVLLVMTLLSLIVLALTAVFNSTQKAFRASVTQTDVLEGSRAAVDLIASDLRGMVPSYGVSNSLTQSPYPPVNFFVVANGQTSYEPLPQNLPGGSVQRTNLLSTFFVLGRVNTKWTGVGYAVDATNNSTLYSLYRFYAETNVNNSPWLLYNLFADQIAKSQWTNMSHVIDGVVQLTVRAYDPNGRWINGNLSFPIYTNALNTLYFPPAYGEAQIFMYSNTVPASVELDLGVMEDATLARAESLSVPGKFPWQAPAQWQFLQDQSGRVHLFRQRVTIPNLDQTAYQ